MTCDTCAVIAAGGKGLRFKNPHGKQYTPLLGHPLCFWALKACLSAHSVGACVIVCADEHAQEMRERVIDALMCETGIAEIKQKTIYLASAQDTRQASVYAGLAQVPAHFRYVAIHDGARPLLMPKTLDASLELLRSDPSLAGCICATPVTDTIKRCEDAHACVPLIQETCDRSQLYAAQTPQSFVRTSIIAAHEAALRDGFVGTDDASLCERLGQRVALFPAPRDNMKVTLPEDLAVARALLCARAQISKE